jgi:hypothetical protein
MNIPAAGKYPAHAPGQLVVTKAKTGSLCVVVPVQLVDSNPPWTGMTWITLIASDGTVQEKNVDRLKTIFGWNDPDPFWLMYENPEKAIHESVAENNDAAGIRDLTQCPFDVDCEHVEYTPEGEATRTQFKVAWMNPPGSSGGSVTPANRAEIQQKFGNVLRTLFAAKKTATKPATSKPAEKKTEPAKAAATTAPAKSSMPGRKTKSSTDIGTGPTATAEEAWAACQATCPDSSAEEQRDAYYAVLDRLFPGKENDDLDPKQFGALKTEFESGGQ